MSRIPFDIRTISFATNLGVVVPAQRPYLATQFVGKAGLRLPYPSFLDTGSAFSVIPYRLACQLPWRDLGAYLLVNGNPQPLEWHGIPCRLGELQVELVDLGALVRTAPLRVVAKIAAQPGPVHLDQAALLGMSFLTDNSLRQELDATGPNMVGCVWVP